jgi:hypothetical protein
MGDKVAVVSPRRAVYGFEMRALSPLLVVLLVAGCADLRFPWAEREPPVDVTVAPGEDVPRPQSRPDGAAPGRPLAATGLTAATLDRPSATERAAAQAGAGRQGSYLGDTLASLGAPGETGFWLLTGLVSEPVQGRVETESGQSVGVELRPSGRDPGAGSQISLSAMRALDLSLAALAPLRVYAIR